MDIRELDQINLCEYNKLVDMSIDGTIFHKTWWLDIFRNFYGISYNVYFYGIFENDDLIAAMPIPIHNKLGVKCVYLPKLTPYLGSLIIDKSFKTKERDISWKKKINKEFAIILKNSGVCLYYSFGHNAVDIQPFKWYNFNIGVHYTYVLKLCELNNVWGNINRHKRREINNSYKYDHTITFGEINKFLELHRLSMGRQNHSVLSEELWGNIFDTCKKNNSCEIFTVYHGTEVAASLFLIWDNKRSYYIGGGVNANINNRGMMSLLMWEAIKYTKEKLNLDEFDFEGSDVRSIESYFRKFGGNIKPIFSISENSIKIQMIVKLYNLYSHLRRLK